VAIIGQIPATPILPTRLLMLLFRPRLAIHGHLIDQRVCARPDRTSTAHQPHTNMA
jgi:hypothetical protein